jgi:hypothetical protein
MKTNRSLRNRKGWLRIVEIILASVLIFVSLINLSQTQTVEFSQPSEWDKVKLKLYGEDVLRALDKTDLDKDNRGDLRIAINESDWSSIGANITNLLPLNVDFTLYLYSANDSVDYETGVLPANIPAKRNKVSVYYPIAQNYGEYCDFEGKSSCALKIVLWYKQ